MPKVKILFTILMLLHLFGGAYCQDIKLTLELEDENMQ
jgi:hypothetical protein